MNNKQCGTVSIDVDTLEFDLILNKKYCLEAESVDLSMLSYSKFLSRFLCFCDKHDIKATFFIVAKHALNKRNSKIIKTIADNGHEIANHTLNHLKNFAYLDENIMEEEISIAGDILSNITGKPILGFRSPGFVVNSKIISVLIRKGYLYDSSILPSWTYNALKIFLKFFWLKGENKKYLTIQDVRTCFSPTHPYFIDEKSLWKRATYSPLIEIPMNVVPFIRYPFVSSYISFLGFNTVLYFYYLVRRSAQNLHYQFHDNEFVSSEDLRENPWIENRFLTRLHLQRNLDVKLDSFDRLFSHFSSDCSFLTMIDLARKMSSNSIMF